MENSTEIIFIRHGETDFNKAGLYFGHLDPGLNETGRRQLERTKRMLGEREKNIGAVFSSDLKRCYESMEILQIDENVEKILLKDFREINFGIFEGKTYEEAVGGRWKMDTPMPESVKNITVTNVNNVKEISETVDFVFSAVDMTKEEIQAIEEEYAKNEVPVVSNNSAHRWTPDVPMVIPEINPDHFKVIESQKKRLGTTRGFIAVKPNCSIQSYVPALTAWKEFEPYEVVATTYQAISGAGKTFDDWQEMVENVIPYIGGEEEKSEKEPLRVWGHIENGQIVPATEPAITCQCLRVAVLNGHTAAAFVKFRKKPTKEQLIKKLEEFGGIPQELKLPSAPKQFIRYISEENRPQVKLDVDYEKGMGVNIGRIREDSVYDFKFIGLSHNTVRGAAGGAILCAEALTALGYIKEK